jgi:hypothetical protein
VLCCLLQCLVNCYNIFLDAGLWLWASLFFDSQTSRTDVRIGDVHSHIAQFSRPALQYINTHTRTTVYILVIFLTKIMSVHCKQMYKVSVAVIPRVSLQYICWNIQVLQLLRYIICTVQYFQHLPKIPLCCSHAGNT